MAANRSDRLGAALVAVVLIGGAACADDAATADDRADEPSDGAVVDTGMHLGGVGFARPPGGRHLGVLRAAG